MADARVVYGSTGSLYVATEKWINPAVAPDQVPASETTVIDRFDVTDPDRTTYRSSGEVPGYVLNQFSLSEDKGFLRVATTSRPLALDTRQAPTELEDHVVATAFSNRPVDVNAELDRSCDDRSLGDRHVDDSLFAKAFLETFRYTESSSQDANVFALNQHLRSQNAVRSSRVQPCFSARHGVAGAEFIGIFVKLGAKPRF